jgi:fumarate reductase subunit D
LLFLLPLFGFVLCELMVLLMSLIGQLIVIRIIFIPLFIIALTFVLEAGQNSLDIQVFRIVVYGAISIGISYLIFLLTKKVSKERLVTSH